MTEELPTPFTMPEFEAFFAEERRKRKEMRDKLDSVLRKHYELSVKEMLGRDYGKWIEGIG